MNPIALVALVSALLSGIAGFGAAWHWQGTKLTELRLDHANERIAIQRASRVVIERVAGQITQAQADAAVRNVGIRADANLAADVAGWLRIASTAAVRASTESPDTCGRVTAAYSDVFGSCVSTLQLVAADADRCFSEQQTLSESWPK